MPFIAGVNFPMRPQVGKRPEGAAARRASERKFARVHPPVRQQGVLRAQRLPAYVADEVLRPCVLVLMCPQRPIMRETAETRDVQKEFRGSLSTAMSRVTSSHTFHTCTVSLRCGGENG